MSGEIVYGSVLVRPQEMRVGDSTLSHEHNFDHLHPSRRGGQRVETLKPIAWGEDGQPTEFDVLTTEDIYGWQINSRVPIKAKTWHRITAIPPKAFIEPEMLEAGRKAAPDLSDERLLTIFKAMFEADPVSLSDCIYSHRVPQLLIQNKGKNDRFDALLDELCALSEDLFGDVVQTYQGYMRSYE